MRPSGLFDAWDTCAAALATGITGQRVGRSFLISRLGLGGHDSCLCLLGAERHKLARAYLHAWQVTQDNFYRRITEQTLDYVAREMTHLRGGFFSSQDADSEGDEGKFYIWRIDEIRAIFGDHAKIFCDYYGVTERGNFEGATILSVVRDIDVVAAMHKLSIAETQERLEAARQKLFALRESRIKPARDEKVLTAWNGLMLAVFAEAAPVLKRDDYRAFAEPTADFILREMRRQRSIASFVER